MRPDVRAWRGTGRADVKLKVDLHMHSCLSPCADDDMTPNNLVNMAWLNGLDAIAVSDHNTARNLPAVKAAADARGLLLLPALEVTTREEVHVLCYFQTVEQALAFDRWVYERLPDIQNVPRFFGRQVQMDADDEAVAEEKRLLISAIDAGIDEVARTAREMGGLPVPAHINRGANGLLTNLGFIPQSAGFCAVEVSRRSPVPAADLSAFTVLYASDAHRLEDIPEDGHLLEVESRDAIAIFQSIAKRAKG